MKVGVEGGSVGRGVGGTGGDGGPGVGGDGGLGGARVGGVFVGAGQGNVGGCGHIAFNKR